MEEHHHNAPAVAEEHATNNDIVVAPPADTTTETVQAEPADATELKDEQTHVAAVAASPPPPPVPAIKETVPPKSLKGHPAAPAKAKKENSERLFSLAKVNPCITCSLCRGYFIDPATITECMHTFCKSCLVLNLQKQSKVPKCPACFTDLPIPNPFDGICMDRTLETIVFKLVPGLKENEEQRRKDYAAIHGLQSLPADSQMLFDPKRETDTPKPRPAPVADDDELVFCVEPETPLPSRKRTSEEILQPLNKPYIKSSSRLPIHVLRKYVAKRLNRDDHESIDILCRGEVMGREYSVAFINATRWRNQTEGLKLQYRVRSTMV